MDSIGVQTILDLYDCDVSKFTRESIENYFIALCGLINMNREDLHFWDYEDVPDSEIPHDQPHLVGVSAVQFISTSNITIHTMVPLKEAYIDIFSCKDYNTGKAAAFTIKWFGAKAHNRQVVIRGRDSKIRKYREQRCVDCKLYYKKTFCWSDEVKEEGWEKIHNGMVGGPNTNIPCKQFTPKG